jgi:hypothetical protein
MFRHLLAAATAASVLLLAACGGGGGGDQPAASPTPTVTAAATAPSVAVPPAPSEFTAYPDAIAAYLTEARGDGTCLADVFAAWVMPQPTPHADCLQADLDGDGLSDDYVVRIVDAHTIGPPLEVPDPAARAEAEPVSLGGDILILHGSDAGYAVVYRATVRDGEAIPFERFLNPAILGAQDYNDDGKIEVAFTGTECGAHTCMTSVFVVGWDGSEYVDLFAEPVMVPWTKPIEIEFLDLNADGIQEIRIPAGTISSVGAGPQRDSVLTYGWNGTNYVLTDTRYSASDFLYFAVVDADAAYAEGNPARATSLYRKAIEDTSLKDWKEGLGTGAHDRDELVPYARFRFYLTQTTLLPTTDVETALSLVGSIEGLAREYPNSLHAQAAERFGEVYREQGTPQAGLTAGCAAFAGFLEERRSEFDAAWDYGYANPKPEPEQLCPQ